MLVRARVEELRSYRWSSYPVYVGSARNPGWLTTSEIYLLVDCCDMRKGFTSAGSSASLNSPKPMNTLKPNFDLQVDRERGTRDAEA